MKNENRAAFGRAPEPTDYAFELPAKGDDETNDVTSPPPAGNILTRILGRLLERFRQHQDAMALQELSDDQLKDIGISRCQSYGGYSRHRLSSARDLERRCQ